MLVPWPAHAWQACPESCVVNAEAVVTAPSEARVRAGNTGTGIYGDWPCEGLVVDVRQVTELNFIRSTQVSCCGLQTSEASALCRATALALQHNCSWVCLLQRLSMLLAGSFER